MVSSRTLRIFRNGLNSNSTYLRYGRFSNSSHKLGHTIIPNRSCASCEIPSPSSNTTTTTPNVAESTTDLPVPPADHRQLGLSQELFINSVYSPGSPLFLPDGTKMFNSLTTFLRAQYQHFGFDEVITPTIYKKSLWEKSGHWENYAEDMFSVVGRGASGKEKGQKGEDEEYGLKPMNCPGHCLIFASKRRSYRDMPVRYADFSPLHRNEVSGSLSGLTRVRRFHQDDGHIFCRPSQIEEEIAKSLEFVRMIYTTLGLGSYRLALSTRPKDYIGTAEEWDNAEAALMLALDKTSNNWTLNEGDGAFYGPKIDIILKDSDGKEHQTATIQLDFQLPKRFELQYQAPAPELEAKGETTTDPTLLSKEGPVTPVMIHRAILGSVERMMALLIEHYNGHYPFWLNPRKAILLTVNNDEDVMAWAHQARDVLEMPAPTQHIRGRTRDNEPVIRSPGGLPWPVPPLMKMKVDLDDRPRSIVKKIKDAKEKRYGAIIVVGARDIKDKRVAVDLSGISDRYGFLKSDDKVVRGIELRSREAGREIPESPTQKDLESVFMKPRHLRDSLLNLAKAYA